MDAGPGGLADLPGHDLAGVETLAVDGVSVRSSRHHELPAVHVPATSGRKELRRSPV
ncbi:hypothetical protein ACFVVB_02700 [Streptomyces californicus]|uniref:hypothetical protein n=1 Tax=Streptomyces californicus TaxID=67351 RepID=UPI0036DF36A3